MTPVSPNPRQFSVHAHGLDRHQARLLSEVSFEAAAVAYVEDFHPPVDQDNAVNVIVRAIDTGHEHCYRIDLDTGDAAPCG